MDVQLPDGTIIRGVPDGMTRAELAAKLRRNGYRMETAAPGPSQQDLSPANEVGALEAALIGAGRTTDKVVQGVRQLWNKAIGDSATLAQMAEAEREKDASYAKLKQARPMATGIGEALPALAVPIGGTGAQFVLRSALAGGVPGALEYGSAEERAKRGALGALGGAVGGLAGLGLGRLLKPTRSAAGISDDAAAAAERVGLKLSAGERTQNPALVNLENYLSRSPGSSGAMQARTAANQQAVNDAALSAIGLPKGGSVGEGAFSAAKDAIGAEFGRLGTVTRPKIGDDFMAALVKLDGENMARGPFKVKEIDSLIEKGLDLAARGELSGVAYKEIRTQLTNDAKAAFSGGNSTLGQAIKTVRAALDDAAKESLSRADQRAWDVARRQWAAYKTLTRGNVAEAGNVSPARVASVLRQKPTADAFRTGSMNGPLADIGRVGEAVKASSNPNSGQLMAQMLYGNPFTGVPLMAANAAGRAAYMSGPVQKYLTDGVVSNPVVLDLIRRSALPGALPALPAWLGAE